MEEVVIVNAVRTAIGRYGGALRYVPAPELAALVLKEAVKRAGLEPEQVDEVVMGHIIAHPARLHNHIQLRAVVGALAVGGDGDQVYVVPAAGDD